MEKIHIGNQIRTKLIDEGRTVTWFARQLNCRRNKVYRIFESPDVDIGTLRLICKILNCNFFTDLCNEIDNVQNL